MEKGGVSRAHTARLAEGSRSNASRSRHETHSFNKLARLQTPLGGSEQLIPEREEEIDKAPLAAPGTYSLVLGNALHLPLARIKDRLRGSPASWRGVAATSRDIFADFPGWVRLLGRLFSSATLRCEGVRG